MKSFALVLVTLFAGAAFAADTGQITMQAPKTQTLMEDKANITEAGFHYSSINDGSAYATVGVVHEFDNGFALGVRAFLPVEFNNQAQAYIGEAMGRFILYNEVDLAMNSLDQMYIEGTLAQGFFNGEGDGHPFVLMGADYGYMHHFTDKFAAGGNLGLDYSGQRITHGDYSNDRTLYSKLTLLGSYTF
jgi:hypothetical protein